ncbi:hypothetical protein CSAL01_12835 [Colletotrichum salicis]|uniref:Uncharacterized protein n=1 Tax=Colletotrichum salicis TaxID=1209931 RepID=A0A135V0C1_9PEZI|nr:hypothetical protein CSAL01_12835 [Colletotrichum salicis]
MMDPLNSLSKARGPLRSFLAATGEHCTVAVLSLLTATQSLSSLSSLPVAVQSFFARQVPTWQDHPIPIFALSFPLFHSHFPPSTFLPPTHNHTTHHATLKSATHSPYPTDPHREKSSSLPFIVFGLGLHLRQNDDTHAKPSRHWTPGQTFHTAGFLHRRTERVVTGVAAPDFGTIPRVSLPATAYRKGRIHTPSLTNTLHGSLLHSEARFHLSAPSLINPLPRKTQSTPARPSLSMPAPLQSRRRRSE